MKQNMSNQPVDSYDWNDHLSIKNPTSSKSTKFTHGLFVYDEIFFSMWLLMWIAI